MEVVETEVEAWTAGIALTTTTWIADGGDGLEIAPGREQADARHEEEAPEGTPPLGIEETGVSAGAPLTAAVAYCYTHLSGMAVDRWDTSGFIT